jgi:hypothetical protein
MVGMSLLAAKARKSVHPIPAVSTVSVFAGNNISSGPFSVVRSLVSMLGQFARAPMRKLLLWLGALFCGMGLAVVMASAVMGYMGLNASFNLGDPAKFEFVLVPFWQIGLVIAGAGVASLFGSYLFKTNV